MLPSFLSGPSEHMVKMTIPNFNWVGTPKDSRYLTVTVPPRTKLIVGAPAFLREEGARHAEIPFLRSPNGAELMIGVGRIDGDLNEATDREPTTQVGRWKGKVEHSTGLGMGSISFHVTTPSEYAIGGVHWPEGNEAAASEARAMFDSVLNSVQQADRPGGD